MPTEIIHPVRSSPVRDVYRFGDGPAPFLQPGTIGWTASEFEDPILRRLWDQGRYEIIDGVLTVMPPAFFIGGEPPATLCFFLRSFLRNKKIPAAFSNEVDIQINDELLLRADAVAVFGDDLPKFKALKFPEAHDAGQDWRQHALTIPPSLVIESVSKGHEKHDGIRKHAWYAEFGISRYWIADAYTKSLECLRLTGGQYVDDTTRDGDILSVQSITGFTIPLGELWG